ncbi:MAG: threonine/serine dehydratase [Povalibacter sp.]
MVASLTLSEIRAAAAALEGKIVRTPTHTLRTPELKAVLPTTEVVLKLELFQLTGTFKARAALLNVMALSDEQRARGVTAISAGNHAIAVAFAAASIGVSARVVMISTANPLRVELCRAFGAEIIFAPNAHAGFERVKQVELEEKRTLIHPFEGRVTALGTSTVGLEFMEQIPGLDAVIVPIGGGGLCAGIASCVKLLEPSCQVFGVEPEGADSMYRSFQAGSPQSIERVATIADSLGAPYALPISFELCRRNVDGLVRVSDVELRAAMRLLLRSAKLAVEPAAAAATAALLGPLKDQLAGKRVGLIVCGSNIDSATFARLIAEDDQPATRSSS